MKWWARNNEIRRHTDWIRSYCSSGVYGANYSIIAIKRWTNGSSWHLSCLCSIYVVIKLMTSIELLMWLLFGSQRGEQHFYLTNLRLNTMKEFGRHSCYSKTYIKALVQPRGGEFILSTQQTNLTPFKFLQDPSRYYLLCWRQILPINNPLFLLFSIFSP